LGIKIVSDNSCDLPQTLLEAYDIAVVPLRVRFGDEEIPPDNFDNASFYSRMQVSPFLPSTNQPSPGDFIAAYEKARNDNNEVISIHLSSGISGTVQSASLAVQMMGDSHIHVIDSLKASVGEGLMVLEAARLAQKGADVQFIKQRMEEMQHHLRCIFVVGNLEALIKGGRLSKTKALIAGTLGIKPVLHMEGKGRIVPFDRARGHAGAINKLLEVMGKMGHKLDTQTLGICHSSCLDDALYLQAKMRELFAAREVIIGEIGPVIGSHVGPGTFSVFFESREPLF